MADTRRTKSLTYLCAAAIGIGIALSGLVLSELLRIVILLVCVITAIIAGRSHYWQVWFYPAVEGARAEEAISAKLVPLIQRGWKLKFNQPVPHYGNVDILCVSPNQNLFAIDVKATKGTIRDQSGRLFVLSSLVKKHSFEGRNLLLRCRGQAEAIRLQRPVKCVYPMLCFAHAVLKLKVSSIEGI